MVPHRESAVPSRRRPLTAPDCDDATAEEVRALADFISRSERLLVITGAGVSTESSVPDYRSPRGSYSVGFKPMTHQDFLRADENRRRYWARSFVGWKRFAERTRPNPAHDALAALQREGHVWRLITQNVDRLHHAAGSEDVLELHGTTHEVICLACGVVSPRRRMQKILERLNPDLIDAAEALAGAPIRVPADESDEADGSDDSVRFRAAQRPDGDAEIDARRAATFEVPPCASCGGGPLKPRVVFFGDGVPAPVVAEATAASEGADAVLVVGSSVSTFSAFRLVRDAAARGAPVAVLTAGETRVDPSRRSRWNGWRGRRSRGCWRRCEESRCGGISFRTRAHLERRERERHFRPDDPSTRRPGRRCRSFVTYITSNGPARGAV